MTIGTPDGASPGISRAAAIKQLDGWLQGTLGATPVAASDVSSPFADGWDLTITVEGTATRLRLLVDDRFPWTKPRVALADPPPFPSYPHVEQDGLICVLAEVDEADPREPVGTAKAVLAGAEDVLLKGITGANADDFRTEFLSYWNPGAKGRVRSILEPWESSRTIKVWPGKSYMLAAETADDIRNWLANNVDKKNVAAPMIASGLLVWLAQPLLPAEYPAKPDDVLALAASVGAGNQLLTLLRNTNTDPLVLFGAETQHGVCFGGIRLVRSNTRAAKRAMKTVALEPGTTLNTGFTAVRYAVDRADPWWVHGRDSNDSVESLRSSRVAVIGCGSLGSPIAQLLAQAGVGAIDLIDPEALQWANIGRHALGADSVDMSKADRLARLLNRSFPHARVMGHRKPWQDARHVLTQADLIVTAVGGWSEEGELNEVHLARAIPPVLYGWLEPHGVAAHAILLGHGSGCLQCGLGRHGEPRASVVSFTSSTLKQIPACGGYFQPYGATATAMAAALAADLAVDFLLDRADMGSHRVASARSAVIEAAEGSWSPAWIQRFGDGHEGGRTEEFEWTPAPDCVACGGKGVP